MTATLEKRVRTLELKFDEIHSLLSERGAESKSGKPKKDWRNTIGKFKDDPLFDEIVRLGAAYRRRQPKC